MTPPDVLEVDTFSVMSPVSSYVSVVPDPSSVCDAVPTAVFVSVLVVTDVVVSPEYVDDTVDDKVLEPLRDTVAV